jgi:hypothetical protein
MWLAAVYHQLSMFSLKPSDATSTGGRSLLVPTPFSIKMALLDSALRLYGASSGNQYFELIRDLTIAISPPPQLIVNNCFMRIHKPRRSKGDQGEEGSGTENDQGGKGPFTHSVAFREYVQYNGPLGLAFEVDNVPAADALTLLLAQITYLGKRGGLFQLDSPPMRLQQFPARQRYLGLTRSKSSEDNVADTRGVLQVMDDCGPKLTFAKVNIYSSESPGKDRIVYTVALPYQLKQSSRGFTLYERIT